MNISSMTLAELRHLTIHQLEPWMVYAPWRSNKDYAQRRIHQRVDNASKDFRGWRVSVESTADAKQALSHNRLRCQKSFYFGTVGSFEGATLEAQVYRDSCERALSLVPWRLKKLEHVEDAFAVSGIVLNVGKRAPFWIYRQNGRRLIGSIAQMGLRQAYEWLAEQVGEIEGFTSLPEHSPLPLLTSDQERGLLTYGIHQEDLNNERQHTQRWAQEFVRKTLAG